MRKIYFQNKVIRFVLAEDHIKSEALIENPIELRKWYPRFFALDAEELIQLYCRDVNQVWEQMCDDFFVFEAAGGCVLNEKDELLCIYRFGKWDLPKGKQEDGELHHETALREVEEETGLSGLVIEKPLPSTYHMYKLRSKDVVKRTYWYQMRASSSAELIPQTEEGIEDIRWVAREDLPALLQNTYASLKDLFGLYV